MDQASESREALEGLLGTSNESELLKPRVKPSLESSWAAIVAAYALLAAVGAALNLGLLVLVAVRRLHRQPAMGPTMCLLANLAVAHLVQCLAGLPLTLAGMLFANWVLGGFCCYFLPMIQVSCRGAVPGNPAALRCLRCWRTARRQLLDALKYWRVVCRGSASGPSLLPRKINLI
ncbi:hypothetical protein ONE63_009378 [Megalurothrips usitatus]|uniref:G-protein coupled receptors family 1 profile domain-containing protein n=1 Tax=Megalurothrips usitatus TaxID=439358 RepID=A0AAV7XRA5_9NEOP|nr:hypothetical protein ONE63_009378 [Megalurothrips usitatus]